MRRGLNPMQAAIEAGYSESAARTHVYPRPETAEARAEILHALDGEEVDGQLLAKHLKEQIIKGDVRDLLRPRLQPRPSRQPLRALILGQFGPPSEISPLE